MLMWWCIMVRLCMVYPSHQAYRKSSIRPPGGLFNFGPSREGLNPLNAELFPGHCTVMLDNIRKISNMLITNFKLLFHQEEVCQFEIKVYESCSEITEVLFLSLPLFHCKTI